MLFNYLQLYFLFVFFLIRRSITFLCILFCQDLSQLFLLLEKGRKNVFWCNFYRIWYLKTLTFDLFFVQGATRCKDQRFIAHDQFQIGVLILPRCLLSCCKIIPNLFLLVDKHRHRSFLYPVIKRSLFNIGVAFCDQGDEDILNDTIE